MSNPGQAVQILLVEDSPDDVFFFRRAVKKTGLAAVTHVAVDGIEATDYLLNRGRFADAAAHPPPDIVFLDLKLPHRNGFEVLDWLGRLKDRPQPPVVVLTSSNQPDDQARAEALGAVLYLTKPAASDQLLQALRTYAAARLGEPEAGPDGAAAKGKP